MEEKLSAKGVIEAVPGAARGSGQPRGMQVLSEGP
jgi:hypothetical protein